PFLSDWLAALRDPHSFPTRRSSDLKSQFLTMAVKGVPRVDNDFNLRPRFNIREQCLVKIWADRQDFTGCLYILSLIGVWDVNASDRKSTRLNSSHVKISYAVFCLKN